MLKALADGETDPAALAANIWFVDPKKRIGWDCTSGDWIRKHRFEVEESPIYLSLDELFCQVDANEE